MRCFIAGFSKTTMPKKTTMKPKGPSQEGDPSWHHVVRSADDACTRAKQKTWRLKIHNVKPETKPDKDGFLPMRIFGKSANAEYRLEYYGDQYSIHQLDKARDYAQSWFPIQEKEAQHLLNGIGLIVERKNLFIILIETMSRLPVKWRL